MSRTLYWAAALFLAAPATLVAQARTPADNTASLEGAWKVVERTVTGDGARTEANPQPGLFIFTKKHYSTLSIAGTTSRPEYEPAKDPAKLTDAEKLARFEQWNLFGANAGTYELKGSTLTVRPIVAKNQGVMTGNPVVREVTIQGNTLWIVQKSATGETRTKYTRVE